jgi:hypothetical protein
VTRRKHRHQPSSGVIRRLFHTWGEFSIWQAIHHSGLSSCIGKDHWQTGRTRLLAEPKYSEWSILKEYPEQFMETGLSVCIGVIQGGCGNDD